MSLRFVTRKLKTQTLGDDDAEVEVDTEKTSVALETQADPNDPHKEKDVVSILNIG